MSFYTTRHGQFALPIIWYLKPPPVQPFLDVTCSLTFRSWLTGTKLENKGNHWPIVAISARTLNILTTITRYEIKYYWLMKVSSAKQSPHMAKSHGPSLQFIQIELSGFNAEQKWNNLVSGEYNHLQMIFFKLGKYIRHDHKAIDLSPTLTKILPLFDSNTILTSFMTSRIMSFIFFLIKGFFHMIFTSDSFICGGKCHRPWH